MEILELKVNNIKPNEFNPNKMPAMTFKKMVASIKKFGIFNPILVRKKGSGYEIVDGEWRWRSYVDLKKDTIPCRVIKATDEEVKQMIFATKITGRHNAYDAQNVLRDILKEDKETMDACNLDKLKLERKTKYMNFKKGRRLKKDKRDLRDESVGLPENTEYKCVFAVTLEKSDYEEIHKYLKSVDKSLTVAIVKSINRLKALAIEKGK